MYTHMCVCVYTYVIYVYIYIHIYIYILICLNEYVKGLVKGCGVSFINIKRRNCKAAPGGCIEL